MRITPAVTEPEARAWLRAETEQRWGSLPAEYEAILDSLATSMAELSAIEIPEDVEPFGNYFRYGEDDR